MTDIVKKTLLLSDQFSLTSKRSYVPDVGILHGCENINLNPRPSAEIFLMGGATLPPNIDSIFYLPS